MLGRDAGSENVLTADERSSQGENIWGVRREGVAVEASRQTAAEKGGAGDLDLLWLNRRKLVYQGNIIENSKCLLRIFVFIHQ